MWFSWNLWQWQLILLNFWVPPWFQFTISYSISRGILTAITLYYSWLERRGFRPLAVITALVGVIAFSYIVEQFWIGQIGLRLRITPLFLSLPA